MPADLVAITSSHVTAEPKRRQQRLEDARRNALDAVRKALEAADLLRQSPGQRERLLDPLWEDLWDALWHYEQHLEARIFKLESTLRRTLASDKLSDAERRELLMTVYGRKGPARDPKVLTKTELRLIHQYRRLDAAEGQMIRTLLARLDAFTCAAGRALLEQVHEEQEQ